MGERLMSMDMYSYVGFGAILNRDDLTDEFWEEENEWLHEGWKGEVHVITGESDYVFVTKDGLYKSTDPWDSPDFMEITSVLGSTRKEADEIRAVIRKFTNGMEPMLKPYLFVTWH